MESPPTLGTDEVHVWSACLALDESAERAAWSVLDAEERARAARLRKPSERALQVGTRAFVRRVLAVYLGTAAAEVDLAAGPEGKPEIAGGGRPRWPRFSVSHSGSVALVAVSGDHEVGADVEAIRVDLAWREIADRFFAPAEVDALRRVPEADRRRAFFECWVRKEAYLKGLGMGLRRPMADFEVPVTGPGGPVEDPTRADGGTGPVWHVHGLAIEPGYAAAVAVEGEALVTRRSGASLG